MVISSLNSNKRHTIFKRGIFLVALMLLVAGACQHKPNSEDNPEATTCRQFLSKLNQDIKQAGLEDAQYAKLPDFPHLRVDRFLASLLPDVESSIQFHAWLDQSAALATEGFEVELKNLAPEQNQNQSQKWDTKPGHTASKVKACIDVLLKHDKKFRSPGPAIRAQTVVEDNYDTWKRILGVYPLVLLPVAWGINNHQDDLLNIYKLNRDAVPGQAPRAFKNTTYHPSSFSRLNNKELINILGKADNNPLSLPRLTPREQSLLFRHYAPVWLVAGKGPADQIGTVAWSADGSIPVVQTDKKTVYTKLSYTRYKQKVLLQLNYIIWFPERPLSSMFDLLGGHLDGITWRITLDNKGQVLMQDTIHNCGCYHMFYPGEQMQAKTPPDSLEETAFTPQASPVLKKDERYNIHIAHDTHYITQLTGKNINLSVTDSAANEYDLVPYRTLRNLPHPAHGFRSIFNDQGLIPASSRGERYLFWPLGIASAGAMRQWGRHATAFIGRRHFDDPDLIEKNFLLLND